MSLGKWKLSRRRQTTASSGNSNMSSSSSSSSSSLTTRASSPISELSSSNIDINHSKRSRESKTSSSTTTPSSPSSPFSWLRSSRRSSKRKSIISYHDPAFARLHKPFTPENLEHQKLFSTFEWTFGDDNDVDGCRRRRRRRNSLSLSPCASRNATADDYADENGYDYGQVDPHRHILPPTDALCGSLARLSMREAPGGDFDQENTA
ncbi:hypothetical protein F5X97DRAFT_215756 [Nemania serpens]|nr:hypothetical protein F5X97DRAFT_215756 [Nemania serpens]